MKLRNTTSSLILTAVALLSILGTRPAFAAEANLSQLFSRLQRVQASIRQTDQALTTIEFEKADQSVAQLEQKLESGSDPVSILRDLRDVFQDLDAIESDLGRQSRAMRSAHNEIDAIAAQASRFNSQRFSRELRRTMDMMADCEARVASDKDTLTRVEAAADALLDKVNDAVR